MPLREIYPSRAETVLLNAALADRMVTSTSVHLFNGGIHVRLFKGLVAGLADGRNFFVQAPRFLGSTNRIALFAAVQA